METKHAYPVKEHKSDIKPVIKISMEGFLLSANSTGIDFLDMLSDSLKVPAVNYLLAYYPGILDPQSNFDISYRLHDTVYYFSVVSFREAGYVGLYGYRLVHISGSRVA